MMLDAKQNARGSNPLGRAKLPHRLLPSAKWMGEPHMYAEEIILTERV